MTHSAIWAAIEQFAVMQNTSCSGLAKLAGLDPTAFNKSKRWTKAGKPRWPSTSSLAKVLIASHASMHEFAKIVDAANGAASES